MNLTKSNNEAHKKRSDIRIARERVSRNGVKQAKMAHKKGTTKVIKRYHVHWRSHDDRTALQFGHQPLRRKCKAHNRGNTRSNYLRQSTESKSHK